MAARRNKSQARRNSGNGTPGWVWLIAGLVLGAAAFFIVPGLMKKDGDGFFRPQPNPDALPAQVADADSNGDDIAPETSTATSQPDAKTGDDAAKETQYDFYTLLPGKEVQMSDAELAASAREEKAREARAQQAAAATAAATPTVSTATDNPKPVSETPANTDTTTAAVAASATTTAPAASSAPASKDARYILQAGAFGASGDAESTKAKIAMLGLSARVESAQIGSKTVYRVRMGPYGSASELAEAKQKLASGGLPAMAIKAQ
ncbi:SPOR domain-containing protein [Pseudoxanthomonas sp. CF125]|uniref:SPOR domain-containing protein n=1 Tax=Pseudoxanthomonas sp. CF125 TaxID=1855303 RepID=UPI00088078F5|nr:SPOR domain-containing protein [Pseudoxanthomonas sp. CF125]SDR07827.1 Cell division protein FtsN [Pseudoxanthomonas sp. CF125]